MPCEVRPARAPVPLHREYTPFADFGLQVWRDYQSNWINSLCFSSVLDILSLAGHMWMSADHACTGN